MAVYIDLAVNDPANGAHTGELSGVNFNIPGEGDSFIELDTPLMRCDYDDSTKRLQIGRRFFPYVAYQTWVGNWCWDCAKVSNQTAARIANYLMKRGASVNGGLMRTFDKWERGKRFTARDFVVRDDD